MLTFAFASKTTLLWQKCWPWHNFTTIVFADKLQEKVARFRGYYLNTTKLARTFATPHPPPLPSGLDKLQELPHKTNQVLPSWQIDTPKASRDTLHTLIDVQTVAWPLRVFMESGRTRADEATDCVLTHVRTAAVGYCTLVNIWVNRMRSSHQTIVMLP